MIDLWEVLVYMTGTLLQRQIQATAAEAAAY